MFFSRANATVSTPSPQFAVQSVLLGSLQKNPSSPTSTRWFLSTLFTNVDTSSAQPIRVWVVQLAERGYAPALKQRGSFPRSHIIIVGSFLYCTPVMLLVRLA